MMTVNNEARESKKSNSLLKSEVPDYGHGSFFIHTCIFFCYACLASNSILPFNRDLLPLK